MNNTTIGQRINELLAINNVKQKELAKELGVADNIISYFVSGSRTPNLKQIIKISQFFNVSTDYILGITNVSSMDAEVKAVCEYTGLNEKSLLFLQKIKDSDIYNPLINILLEYTESREGALIDWFMDDIIDYSRIRYLTNYIEHIYINDFINEVLIPKGVEISKLRISENEEIRLGVWSYKFRSFIKEKLKKKKELKWYEDNYIHYEKDYITYKISKRTMDTIKVTYSHFKGLLKQNTDLTSEEGVTNGNNTEKK